MNDQGRKKQITNWTRANLDELVESRISDGFVQSPRSRLVGRESELKRANGKSINILTANRYVPSLRNEAYLRYAAVTKGEA